MKALLAALLCMMPVHAHAQSLVLSGGGARGLSHAGAIVALEELGYDFDVVVGTSMGAIIGALYAAGYDANALRDFIAGENWLERFAAEPVLVGPARTPRRALLSFGIGPRPHEGIVATTGVNQRLLELLFEAGVRAGNDFDGLPRRYRAVAADLATGDEVVLGSGDLPRAVRASMAVPGAFAPVPWEGRVLVDGGIIDNLPVPVARALSNDPVVAIDVLRPSTDVRERSAPAIGVRALRLLISNAMRNAAPADILVLPRIDASLGESRFPADASPLLRAGHRAVLEQVPRAPDRGEGLRVVIDRRPASIDTVIIDTDAATARLVRRMMAPVTDRYDAQRIIERSGALYASGLFEGVWPRVEGTALVVDVTKAASTSVSGGAGWDNDAGAAGWAVLRQRLPIITPWELRLTGELDQLSQRATADLSIFSTALPGVTWTIGAHAGESRVRLFAGDSVSGHLNVQRRGAWAGAEVHAPLRDWFVSVLLRGARVEDAESWGPFIGIARAPQPDRVVGVDPVLQAERGFGDEFSRLHARTGWTFRPGRVLAAVLIDAQLSEGMIAADMMPATTPATAPWLPHGSWRRSHVVAAGADVAYPIVLDGYARVRLRLVEERAGFEAGAVWPTVAGALQVGVAAGRGTRGPRLNLALGTLERAR